jgi:hypothetical protein
MSKDPAPLPTTSILRERNRDAGRAAVAPAASPIWT